MSEQNTLIDGVSVPRFLYGTAWKEDQTQGLVELALKQGFRGIDTANQRKHYHEAAVGQGIGAAVAAKVVTREELFIQTKFTFQAGQDHRLPYDPKKPIAEQVAQSCASSLQHLGVDVIDSYVLHGPSTGMGLTAADWSAWRAMEALHAAGKVRLLGVSNVNLAQLDGICQQAKVRPRFVQNRCYAVRGWDRDVRRYCVANDIAYQGFSLLTANRSIQIHPQMVQIAKRHQRSVSQVIFRFALDVGMLPLTGTTNADHMREDLAVFDFRLEADEVARIDTLLA